MHAIREGDGNGYGPNFENQISIQIIATDDPGAAVGSGLPGNKLTLTEAFEVDLQVTSPVTDGALNSNDTGGDLDTTDYDVFRTEAAQTPIGQVSPGIYRFQVDANATAAQKRIWVRAYDNPDSDSLWEKAKFKVVAVRAVNGAQTSYDIDCEPDPACMCPCGGYNILSILFQDD